MTNVVKMGVPPKYLKEEYYAFDPPARGKTPDGQEVTFLCGRCMDYRRFKGELFAVFVGQPCEEENQRTFLLRA
jgi:hypothetical protein